MPIGKYLHKSTQGFQKGNNLTALRKRSRLGDKHTEKAKQQISQTLKGRLPANLSLINANKSGANNPNWKGDKAKKRIRLSKATRPKTEQCEICGALGNICFDHCHTTDKFRGWICNRCNLALGLVKDNTGILEQMIIYLKINS